MKKSNFKKSAVVKGLRKKNSKRHRRVKWFKKNLGKLLFLLVSLLFLIGCCLNFFIYQVQDFSMNPNFTAGNQLLVQRRTQFQRFDVVVIKSSTTDEVFVSRIIGLPGETITYENDQLLVNQQAVLEPFIAQQIAESTAAGLQYTTELPTFLLQEIPADTFLVLGDNRGFTRDSRTVGLISQAEITGKVIFRWFPMHTWRFF
ncbi:signal peptidase I [Enterococcus sp. LJL120]